MKKIKYLIGAFIVGFGLLINNSFGSVYVEGVTLPLVDSNFSSSSNYRYTFSYDQKDNGYATPYRRFFGFTQYYNGSIQYDYGPYYSRSIPPALYSSIILNNSFFSGDFYAGGVEKLSQSSLYFAYNIPQISSFNIGSYDSTIRILFGNGSNFGKNFVIVGEVLDITQSPKYSLGGGYFNGEDFTTIASSSNSSLNFYRLFFNQNVNLSSPLDGFDLGISSGSNMPSSGSVARMELTKQSNRYQTQYNSSPKFISDYGSQGLKGLTFGGYGVGYSYAIDFSQDNRTFYWGNWSFSTLGSRCGLSAMQLGITDFNTLTSNNCLSLGLLLLKGDTYVSRQNNASVIVLGKNPSNYSQILYEQFDCAEDDVIKVVDSEFCTSIGHGYITINGSSDVLPFTSLQNSYTIGDGNSFMDFMFNQGVYGYVSIDTNNNQYCLNSSSSQLCFGLHNTPNLTSLKEYYLQNSGDIAGVGGTVGGEGLNDIVINQPTDYYTYSGLLEIAGSSIFTSGFDVSGSGIYNGNFISNGLGYTLINGVPALTEYHFGFCPFSSVFGQIEPTLSFDGFSWDLLVPFKCLLNSFQYGYLNLNSPAMDSTSSIESLLISDVPFCMFIWIVLCSGSILIVFKFISHLF